MSAMTGPPGKRGEFLRPESVFRDELGGEKFPLEADRYHIYVSFACPWAHRVLLTRQLLGLEDFFGVSVVHPIMEKTKPDVDDHKGWHFGTDDEFPDATGDVINNCKTVRHLYELANAPETRFTVPLIWDKQKNTIVSNESKEIIRFLYTALNNTEFSKKAMPYQVNDKLPSDFKKPVEFSGSMTAAKFTVDLYPESMRQKIDKACDKIYESINNGVYRCGFAQKQEAYDDAIGQMFDSLDEVEHTLSTQKFLVSDDVLTFGDIHLFPTLIRFDEVYVVHFKTNKKRISDYPNIMKWMRRIWKSVPAFKQTTNMEHIKHHYYRSHDINKFGIVPAGPDFLKLLNQP
eukprot:gene623-337_t